MAVQIGDVLRINANMLLDGIDDIQNIWHFTWNGVGGIGDDPAMVIIAADLDAGYQIVNPEVSDLVTYINFVGQNLTQGILLPTKAWPVLVAGANSFAILPPEVSPQVFFRTTRPKTRASKKMGGFTEAANDNDGKIVPAAKALLQLFGDKAVAGFASPIQSLIYGAYNKPLDRFTPVNAAVTQTEWRSLKRRRRGSGS